MAAGMEKQRDSSSIAMRLFATWDVDRATSSTVPRIFNLSINRIILDNVLPQLNSIIVTAKLPLSKRTRHLRSNEIKVTPSHGRIDLDCDISFSIQYPHFLKRKSNILQLVIQRRRKYKNRLPGGFKDLAIGNINLTNVMQQGGLREILLHAADSEMELKGGVGLCVGRIMLTSCYSQAPEHVDDRDKPKKVAEDSDEDTETDYDDVHLDDLNEMPSARSDRQKGTDIDNPRRRRNKNFKQKFAKLIRRFNKMPVEEVAAEVASTSGARPPTAKELEALFEELSDFSDSGPEMLNDDISICSNPRPCLQPFFARSREVLPAIYDGQEVEASESEGEREENGGWSSDADNMKENETLKMKLSQKDSNGSTYADNFQTPSKRAIRVSYDPISISHSNTMNSLGKNTVYDVQRGISLAEQLSSILGSNLSSDGDVVWICNLSEWQAFSSLSSTIPILNCSTSSQVRQTLSHIVNRIQNYCHTNSSNPPITCIGIIGTDRIYSQVLRAYVDCLAHKSSSNWIQYLRFAIIPSTNSLIYRLIEGIDSQLDILCRDIWDRFNDMTIVEKTTLGAKLSAWATNQNNNVMNLQIGEAMLQMMADKNPEGGRIFLPFLCEVRVGNQQCEVGTDEDSGGGSNQQPGISPRDEKESQTSGQQRIEKDGSPPHSPYLRSVDEQELSIDFWVNNPTIRFDQTAESSSNNVNSASINSTTTPTSKKDVSKVTIKAHFKTLIISRSLITGLLSLIYLKKKKKDKMLQKLGMKKGQKQKMEGESSPNQVPSIGRLLCSAAGKNNNLTIIVDGTAYTGIRYFQTSPQWQTHVKSFPIALYSGNVTTTSQN